MYRSITNILFILVIIMVGLTVYSAFSKNTEIIPYIQMVLALVLLCWGIVESREGKREAALVFFILTVVTIAAAIFSLLM